MTLASVLLASAAGLCAAHVPQTRAERCQMIDAILGVPHSRARVAFRDLACVQPARKQGRLLLRATLRSRSPGAEGRPVDRLLLAPQERCGDRFVGDDFRRQGTVSSPHWVVYLKVLQTADGFDYSVALEAVPPHPESAEISAGTACGATGEGSLSYDGQTWSVRD